MHVPTCVLSNSNDEWDAFCSPPPYASNKPSVGGANIRTVLASSSAILGRSEGLDSLPTIPIPKTITILIFNISNETNKKKRE